MDRIIKFNAWLPDLRYMLEDVAVGHGSIGFPFIDEPEDGFYQFLKAKGFITEHEDKLPEWLFDSGEDWCHITEEKRFVLLEYSGRDDIDGKALYEGDLIMHGESIRLIICHDCRWIAKRVNSDEAILLCFSTNPKKIGNIFQNPELMDRGCPFDEKLN